MKYFSTRAGIRRTALRVTMFLMLSVVFVLVFGSEKSRTSSAQIISPEPGWLYVLDSGGMKRESEVLLVDPNAGRVIRRFKAGYAPDMALSPDGTRLFLASTLRTTEGKDQPVLDVINTATGALLNRVNNPDRWVSTVPAYPSQMAVSADGRMLYIFKDHQTSNDNSNYVVTFDISAGQFLSETADLKGCITAQLVPLANNTQLAVICASKADIRFLNLAPSGAAVTTFDQPSAASKLPLTPWSGARLGQNVGTAFASSDGSKIKVIMGDGRFVKIATESKKVLHTDVIDSARRARANRNAPSANSANEDWMAGRWVRFQTASASPDGARLYVGVGRLDDLREGKQWFDQIVVLDPETLERLAVINTSQSFYSLAMSRDGRRLYAIDMEGANVLVVDTESNREIRALHGFGSTPAFAIVAP